MGHKQHAQAQVLLEPPQQGQHIGLHFGVEHAHAFIAEQHLGFQDQGPRNRHPLLLAARELAGQALFKGFRGFEAHGAEPLAGPLARLGPAGQPMDQQRIGDGIAHPHLGVEAGQGVLEHHLDAAPGLPQRRAFESAQVVALEPHGSPAHGRQSHQGSTEGAFAAAGGAHQANGFPLLELQAHPIHGRKPAPAPGRGGQGMPTAQGINFQQQGCGFQRLALAAFPGAGLGDQPLGQGRLGGGEHREGAALFHPLALIEHGDLIAPASRHGQVVADQQQGTAGLVAERLQFAHHLVGHGHIEAGGGFIGDHQGGFQGHRQGDGQPLAHAATEFMGIAAVALGADAHPLQQLLGPGLHLLPPPTGPVGAEGVGQVVANGEQGIEPGHGVLEHQPHRLTPQPPEGGALQLAGVLAHQLQQATALASLGQQLQHGPRHGAFAAP